MHADTHIILQVRFASTRLPGKLLLPLRGITMYEHIVRRLLRCKEAGKLVVATTSDTIPYIHKTNVRYAVKVTVGSEQDVLGRYVAAIREHGTDIVIRATGDNPLVCIPYVDRAVRVHRARGADLTVYPHLPYGSGVEVVRAAALEAAENNSTDPDEREHVTRHFYQNRHRYRILECQPDTLFRRPDLRVTVDTIDDYRNMRGIYNALYRGHPIPLQEVIRFIDRQCTS